MSFITPGRMVLEEANVETHDINLWVHCSFKSAEVSTFKKVILWYAKMKRST